MAKLKAAGQKKSKTPASNARAIPCLVVILIGIGLMCLLFYFSLQSSAP